VKKLTIAVSGINAVDNPGPGVGVIRSLKESALAKEVELRCIGLAYDAMEPGIYLHEWIDKSYLMPYPSSSRDVFIDRLRYIHQKEKIDVIISALDAELPIYMDIENILRDELGIKMLIPAKEMFRMRDKTKLQDLAIKVGAKAPPYINCSSYADLLPALDTVGYPCMVKGPFYEAFKANSLADAETYFAKIAMKWGYPIIVQKFIYGDEFNVIGCGDGKGGDMGTFAIRKMTITGLGKVWNAVSIANPRLLETTQKVVSALKWRGGFELEVMVDSKTEDIYIIEINPRFPAWVYMASASGVNLPERMVRMLTGLPYETASEYASGKMMIRHTAEVVRDISEFEAVTTFGETSL